METKEKWEGAEERIEDRKIIIIIIIFGQDKKKRFNQNFPIV